MIGVGSSIVGPTNKLFIRNLCFDTEVSTLQELFPEASSIFLPKDKETGQRRGYGTVQKLRLVCWLVMT